MRQDFFQLDIETHGKALVDISETVRDAVKGHRMGSGLLTIWCPHTGASLLVQASADAEVASDIEAFFERLVPKQPEFYDHKPQDLDNAPSHLRASLLQTQMSLPIEDGKLPLGKVQSLFLFEHREAPKTRKLKCHFIGVSAP